MNFTPQQLKIQEAMLLRLYPGKSLEQVRRIEYDLWCYYLYQWYVTFFNSSSVHIIWDEFTLNHENWKQPDITIIWLPPTLPRLLDSLWFDYTYMLWDIVQITSMKWHTINGRRTLCKRKLRNEDSTDANLRDQSIETQDAIGDLFIK